MRACVRACGLAGAPSPDDVLDDPAQEGAELFPTRQAEARAVAKNLDDGLLDQVVEGLIGRR